MQVYRKPKDNITYLKVKTNDMEIFDTDVEIENPEAKISIRNANREQQSHIMDILLDNTSYIVIAKIQGNSVTFGHSHLITDPDQILYNKFGIARTVRSIMKEAGIECE